MATYITKRLLQAVLVLLGITAVVFFVLNLTGDPVELMLPPTATLDDIAAFRADHGFDDPIIVQYGRFLKGLCVGDFGTSYYYDEPALDLVLERLPATLELTLASLFMALIWGIPAGIISAVKRNSKTDVLVRIIALVGQCIPVFWLGIMMIMLFAVELHWLPTAGRGTFWHLVMPAFCLGVFTSASITRLLRSGMIDIMGKDFIRVARAKGLSQKVVVIKHAFKNAISSVLTLLGLQVAALLGGAVITETVFAWPGIGRLAVESIHNRDFMVVEAVVIVMALGFVLINLIVDILYSIIDPRVSY
ncbi:glutathione ABC transporter permease [Dethiosulfatarculus sandiegensis]|uniref:Glutathione ABC transporter permease n=2 Tax=Dethiosulfatarculus sandiegensis TaxID=1429043 RepID=A0A0D2JBE0_9BACT|nr:ABC transporter permease [Dethiosulfatarculus sandiegensis]KIX13026.1 glutathione ABC transporter permease [Dethiosulfatarculus sandiegensis]